MAFVLDFSTLSGQTFQNLPESSSADIDDEVEGEGRRIGCRYYTTCRTRDCQAINTGSETGNFTMYPCNTTKCQECQ